MSEKGSPFWRKAPVLSYEPAPTVWLGLVRQRCLRRSLEVLSDGMSKGERVKLLDAAMKSHNAAAYLDGVRATFDYEGRCNDATFTAVIRTLLLADEIETVMHMRAEWVGERSSL